MAARTNKPEHIQWKFYTYEILDREGNVIYVGKGINRRATVSMKQRGGIGYRMSAYFYDEDAAFKHEEELIASHSNLLNANKGGFGGKVRVKKIAYRKTKFDLLLDKIGTRAYCARLLVSISITFNKLASKLESKQLSKMYSEDTIDMIRRIDLNKMMEIGYGTRA